MITRGQDTGLSVDGGGQFAALDGADLRRTRIAIVQPAMAPYRFACFSALAQLDDLELLVIYLERGALPYDWETDQLKALFPWVELSGPGARRTRLLPNNLVRTLKGFRPDVTIVGGWDRPSYFVLSAARPLFGRRIVVWTESTPNDWRRQSQLRRIGKRLMLRLADGVLLPGSAARLYCQMLTPAVERYFVAPNAVDNVHFSIDHGARCSLAPIGSLSNPIFLYVGRLDEEKGVDILLRAWGQVQNRLEGSLAIVGEGEKESELKALAADMGLERVRFVGFVGQDDLPLCYEAADIFVFPTLSDPWGLVINEAMATGLPVVATTAAGATPDLVRDGVNGRVVPPGDVDELVEAMCQLGTDRSLRRRMGTESLHRIDEFTPEGWASAVAAMSTTLL